MKISINCMGMACPLPVVQAKKAMEGFTEDGLLKIKVDNDTAVQNLTRLGNNHGFPVSVLQNAEKEYTVTMEVKADKTRAIPLAAEDIVCPTPVRGGKIVLLSANTMGSGDEQLGKKLMKAFVFALTSQDEVPDKVICYNSGAFLTTEDPDTINDLKKLKEAGATIMTCGTCLDFYGLKDKLQVGIISNMYDIVEAQMGASMIIRP